MGNSCISLMIPLLYRTSSDFLSGFQSLGTWVTGNSRRGKPMRADQIRVSKGLVVGGKHTKLGRDMQGNREE